MRRRRFPTVFVVILLACVAFGFSARFALWSWAGKSFGPAAPMELTIASGTSLREMSGQLHSSGVIDNAFRFRLYSFLAGKQNVLRAGQYRFRTPMTPHQVLEELLKGSFQSRLTIPEGWTEMRIEGALLQDGWISDPGQWIRAVAEPVAAGTLDFALPAGAEGFCFPDTYFFEPGAGAGDIRDSMLRQFGRIWRELDPDRRDPRSLAMSPVEVVILASMIQLEARNLQEMADIASVYLNRLKIGMKLQCCATIRHALGEVWDRPLTKEDMSVDSPYNTYRVAGLPPGPIGNPGRHAIEAVLRPSLTTYLYYVYKGDQTHQFSETYKEHLEAVRRFRSNDPMAALTSEAAGNS
ncbi:endolytic transglycosylase MltG [Candidatus Sumerlaeota bacterium]|nr:endolytic transglycosylase MltG [Candidatus Sumerlaeota bacterium]